VTLTKILNQKKHPPEFRKGVIFLTYTRSSDYLLVVQQQHVNVNVFFIVVRN